MPGRLSRSVARAASPSPGGSKPLETSAEALDDDEGCDNGFLDWVPADATCSVHCIPSQYRDWNRPVGSGYQFAPASLGRTQLSRDELAA